MSLFREIYPFLRRSSLHIPVTTSVSVSLGRGTIPISGKTGKFSTDEILRSLSANVVASASSVIVSLRRGNHRPTSREKGWQTFTAGMESFLNHMHENAPDFEFYVMPHHSTFSLIFRPKSQAENEWAPMSVRVAKEQRGRLVFHRLRERVLTNEVFLFDVGRCVLYLVCKDVSTNYVRLYPKSAKSSAILEVNQISDTDLSSVLMQSYKNNERHPQMEWLFVEGVFARSDITPWAESVCATLKQLYDPLGISLSFPIKDLGPNAILNGKVRILQKKIVSHSTRSGHTKYYGHFRFPWLLGDVDIHFFVFVYYSPQKKVITGLFVFPKETIRLRGYLRDEAMETSSGKETIMLYAPGVKTHKPESTATQAWQSEFYIDLSNEDELAENRQRFREILGLI